MPVAAETVTAAIANELAAPMFVLATLPIVVEQVPAPPPVLPATEPAADESLKALAALYSSKPNGTAESAETPVAVAS
jgi:hypothetical protein